jgi:hypothetical protein
LFTIEDTLFDVKLGALCMIVRFYSLDKKSIVRFLLYLEADADRRISLELDIRFKANTFPGGIISNSISWHS